MISETTREGSPRSPQGKEAATSRGVGHGRARGEALLNAGRRGTGHEAGAVEPGEAVCAVRGASTPQPMTWDRSGVAILAGKGGARGVPRGLWGRRRRLAEWLGLTTVSGSFLTPVAPEWPGAFGVPPQPPKRVLPAGKPTDWLPGCWVIQMGGGEGRTRTEAEGRGGRKKATYGPPG